LELLEDEVLLRQAKILSITDELFRDFYNFDNFKDLRVTQSIIKSASYDLKENSIDLDDYLTILELTGRYDKFVKNLLDIVEKLVLPFLFSNNCSASMTRVKGQIQFKIAKTENVDELVSMGNIASNVGLFAEFLAGVVFTSNHRPTDQFVETWSENISKAIRKLVVGAKRKLDESDTEIVQSFEAALMTQGIGGFIRFASSSLFSIA
jgi:hypothetical protein